MGKIVEVDAISDAIIATEKEIAGAAFDQDDTDALDATGDRSLEDMGGGLEGQHEPDDDDETDGEDADGEAELDGEAEAEAAATTGKAPDAQAGKGKEGEAALRAEPEAGRVPSGKLRDANERARAAEAERDAVKGQLTTFSDKLEQAMRRIDDLSRAPRVEPKAAEPPKVETVPDIFEDPKGFAKHLTDGFQAELSRRDQQFAAQRVETSMAIAHKFHKETFEKAWAAVNQLNPNDPDARVAVQRIYSSPDPGEALVEWHRRNETLARVGNDPAAYEERIRTETRQTLLKDPEFRKQLIADLRGEAASGDNGNPRTETRLPRSLALASGSNLGADRGDPQGRDGSDQAVADAAWR